MAQTSRFWATSATPSGDQQASYSGADFADVWRAMGEGVISGHTLAALDGELACSDGGVNTVSVADGAAIIDGVYFESTAAESVSVPSADGAGNTRIDRIVVRVTWASYTAAITRIAGTDAASPSAPAITQTSETTYDLSLCQVLVDTSGNVTVTDERTFLAPQVDNSTIEVNSSGDIQVRAEGINTTQLAAGAVTAGKLGAEAVIETKIQAGAVTGPKLAAGAVTNSKLGDGSVTLAKMAANSVDSDQYVDGSIDTIHIADLQITEAKLGAAAVTEAKIGAGAVTNAKLGADAVDDTKVGNRVPQFYRRQGGSATDWNTEGTTTYTPSSVRMQAGVVIWTGDASSVGTVWITFPAAFSAKPIVFATSPRGDAYINVEAYTDSASTAALYWRTVDGSQCTSVPINWLAIGPE